MSAIVSEGFRGLESGYRKQEHPEETTKGKKGQTCNGQGSTLLYTETLVPVASHTGEISKGYPRKHTFDKFIEMNRNQTKLIAARLCHRVDAHGAGQRNRLRADVQRRRPARLHTARALQAVWSRDEGEERERGHPRHPHQYHRTSLQEAGRVQTVHQQLQVSLGEWNNNTHTQTHTDTHTHSDCIRALLTVLSES